MSLKNLMADSALVQEVTLEEAAARHAQQERDLQGLVEKVIASHLIAAPFIRWSIKKRIF